MDLLDFDGEAMYFDHAPSPRVAALIAHAAEHYGDAAAEHSLMQAYFREPEHLTVLVALYRYFYYQHRYADALLVADRAIALVAEQLAVDRDWRCLSRDDLAQAGAVSMSLTRFLLLALKGAGYLELRLGEAVSALERFEKLVELDTNDRLGMAELVSLARGKVTEERVSEAGGNVAYLAR
jgi:tetratricopeptide (TPR) repeat protein